MHSRRSGVRRIGASVGDGAVPIVDGSVAADIRVSAGDRLRDDRIRRRERKGVEERQGVLTQIEYLVQCRLVIRRRCGRVIIFRCRLRGGRAGSFRRRRAGSFGARRRRALRGRTRPLPPLRCACTGLRANFSSHLAKRRGWDFPRGQRAS